jgi:hypothetical protein
MKTKILLSITSIAFLICIAIISCNKEEMASSGSNNEASVGMQKSQSLPIGTIRGIWYQPQPPTCTPVYGICKLTVLASIPDSGPYDLGSFNAAGKFTMQFVNYDFENDDWLSGDELLFEGDYNMPQDIADKLGGSPITIRAGSYELQYEAGSNVKTVVFP